MKYCGLIAMMAAAGLATVANGDATVTVGNSGAGWLGYMNWFNLPADGGAFQNGSPWAPIDLKATFNDAAPSVTLHVNSINDPNPYWYIGGGGPGAQGNKIMEANLYIETTGVHSGTLTFEGNVLSNTFTSAHTTLIFIKDFAPDYSSFNITTMTATPGAFSISLALVNDSARHVQWGFQTVGVNVWATDAAQFGSVVVGPTVPAPGAFAVLGLGGLFISRRRR